MGLVDADRVKHGKFDPNSSYPTDEELKLVETSSAESTVGSVLSHVTTSIQNSHPNVLEISFVRRSSRLEEKECEAPEQEEKVEEEMEDKKRKAEDAEKADQHEQAIQSATASDACKSYEVVKQKLLAALASDACKISEVAKQKLLAALQYKHWSKPGLQEGVEERSDRILVPLLSDYLKRSPYVQVDYEDFAFELALKIGLSYHDQERC